MCWSVSRAAAGMGGVLTGVRVTQGQVWALDRDRPTLIYAQHGPDRHQNRNRRQGDEGGLENGLESAPNHGH